MPNYNAQVRLTDGGGRIGKMSFQVFGVDADDALVNLSSIADHLSDVTRLGVSKPSITAEATFSATSPVAGSNLDVGGKVKGVSAVDGKIVTLRIPDPVTSILNSTYGFILTDVALDTFLDDFLTAGTGRVSDGEDVATWLVGELDSH